MSGTMVAVGAWTQAAQAQQIETVIVTAEKRSENVQDVPIAITAFSGDAIQEKGIGDLHGLSNLTPNVNLDSGAPFSGDSSVLSASIRGIGQDDFAFNIDPGVGVYVDGVYLARTIGANVDLLDVDRIEVLKGPQGTLFGRNTIGGAISIVTRTPGDKFFVQGQFTGGSFNRRDIALTADIPIADDIKSSITFQSVERDGYQKVIPYNNVGGYNFDPVSKDFATPYEFSNRLGGQNRQSVRGKLLWDFTDDFNMTLTADWTHQDQSSIPNTVMQVFPDTPGAGGSIAGLYTACLAGATIGQLCDLPRADGWPASGGLRPLRNSNLVPINSQTTQAQLATGSIDTTYANGPNYAKFDSEGVGITFSYQLASDMTLKSITGYRHITWNIAEDLDGSADHGNLLEVSDKQQQQQFTQELQLVGTALDSRLSYVAGLYYFYENGFVHDWVPFDGDLLAVEDSGLNLVRTSSYAAYAHADYKVTDQIGLTLGARYSVEDKFFVGGQQDLNGLSYKASGCYPPDMPNNLGAPAFLTCQDVLGYPVAGQPFRYFPAGTNHQTFDEFTPTAGIQYHVTDDAMAYFSWSKGTKSGGWTTRLSALLGVVDPVTHMNIVTNDPKLAEFKPEKATTYEVGLKAEWFDSTLQTNAALFYTDYTNIQLNEQKGVSPVLQNLGNADIYGAELEAQAILGHGFSAHAAVGYLDAYYTSLDPRVHPTPAPGSEFSDITLKTKLPKTPMWKININPEWDHDLGNGQSLQVQVSYTHTSSLYNDSLNTPLLKRPSLDLIDASVRFSFADDKYSIAVGGTNLTDKRYITVGSINYGAGFVDGTFSAPAEWYARLNVKM
ncbi:MAG TPA: TonB-dependent receptor [Rhizomicrobium sp.]